MSAEERAPLSDMTERAKHALQQLGNFGPTANPALREVKGYIASSDPEEDGRTYRDAGQLRELAAGLIDAADWLDARAGVGIPESVLKPTCEHLLGYRTEQGRRVCQTCAAPWENPGSAGTEPLGFL